MNKTWKTGFVKCLGNRKYLKLQESGHTVTVVPNLARHGACPEWGPSLICPLALNGHFTQPAKFLDSVVQSHRCVLKVTMSRLKKIFGTRVQGSWAVLLLAGTSGCLVCHGTVISHQLPKEFGCPPSMSKLFTSL